MQSVKGNFQEDTVDGRNPANLGCIKSCKSWDKLSTNWLARFLPSTVALSFLSIRETAKFVSNLLKKKTAYRRHADLIETNSECKKPRNSFHTDLTSEVGVTKIYSQGDYQPFSNECKTFVCAYC